MFQLNFYHHLDFYHATFRALCISEKIQSIHVDEYRLLDYFLAFPFELGIIRVRGGRLKKEAAKFEVHRPYHWVSDPAFTFLQMTDYQSVAVRSLAQKGLLKKVALEQDVFEREPSVPVHKELITDVDEFLADRGSVLDILIELFDEYGLTGDGGLKSRSGLMPHKYDVEIDADFN